MPDFRVTELDQNTDFTNLPFWDVVVIGAGPAGLAASHTTAHRGLTTLVVEAKDRPGGQPQFLYAHKRIADVPGFPDGITGEELSERVYRQAKNALVQFRFNEELVSIEDTEQVEKDDPLKRVVTGLVNLPASGRIEGVWTQVYHPAVTASQVAKERVRSIR